MPAFLTVWRPLYCIVVSDAIPPETVGLASIPFDFAACAGGCVRVNELFTRIAQREEARGASERMNAD